MCRLFHEVGGASPIGLYRSYLVVPASWQVKVDRRTDIMRSRPARHASASTIVTIGFGLTMKRWKQAHKTVLQQSNGLSTVKPVLLQTCQYKNIEIKRLKTTLKSTNVIDDLNSVLLQHTAQRRRFRDIWLQSACPMQIVIAHARYHVTCTPYAKFGYVSEFPTPTLPIHYDTFIGLRWRLRLVYSWDLQC